VNIISKYYSFYCIFDQSLHLLQHATLKNLTHPKLLNGSVYQ